MILTRKTDIFFNLLKYISYYVDLYTDPIMINSDIEEDWADEPSAFLNIYESYLILQNHLGNNSDAYIKANDAYVNLIILIDYYDNPDYPDFIEYTVDSTNDIVDSIKKGNYIVRNELLKKVIEEKFKVYNKVNDMEHVYLKDIHDEFWSLCIDVDHIRQYIRVFDVKFRRILPLVPAIETLKFKNLNEINLVDEIRLLLENGDSKELSIFLDESKVDYPPLLEKEFKYYLKETIIGLTELVFKIKDMFDSFMLMTEEALEIDVVELNNRAVLTNRQDENIEKLYRNLVESKFISQDSDLDSFKSIFHGYSTSNFIPIKWLSNKQLLRELLTDLKHCDIKIAEIQRLIPTLFIDKQNNPLILAKNKHLDTRESRQIQKFLRLGE